LGGDRVALRRPVLHAGRRPAEPAFDAPAAKIQQFFETAIPPSLPSAPASTCSARTEDPLSQREREVVELVAQALSNREIARRLVLSERTVEAHVRRILAKTGHTSRTELVRWFLTRQS
jgi:DNA-binding NarL/FixJ family response regulator